jgi:hypothetical protein
MLVSELTEKTAGEKKEGKRTPCYFGRMRGRGALAPDTLIRPSAAWHVTMGFPAEIFPWK